ncbi:hypothetical protein [Streptomyces sp. NPDC003077]|uniref:hypothetical protein n=1 Tax=Streptomyces sp. NPDC003077 TaxID=3154443 RepID=UPI0033BB9D30
MIVALVVICEVGFWVLLALGLLLRYVLKLRRTGAVVLLMEPLLEVVLLVVTAIDLKNGARAGGMHGLAAVYIGFTVAYGHYLIKWADGHAAHRFGGGPPPVKPPQYGMARAKHEWKLWVRTVVAAVVATALLQLAIWYVGGDGHTGSLSGWQGTALRIAGIHGLVAVYYTVWPKKTPEKAPEPVAGGGHGEGAGSSPGAGSGRSPFKSLW